MKCGIVKAGGVSQEALSTVFGCLSEIGSLQQQWHEHHPCFVGFNKAISRFIIQKPQGGLNKCLKQLSLLGAIGVDSRIIVSKPVVTLLFTSTITLLSSFCVIQSPGDEFSLLHERRKIEIAAT